MSTSQEKINYLTQQFILVFYLQSTQNAPKMIVLRFPHKSRSSHLPSVLPSIVAACFWLVVVCKMVNQQPSMATFYFFLSLIFVNQFGSQTMAWRLPHTFLPGCVSPVASVNQIFDLQKFI